MLSVLDTSQLKVQQQCCSCSHPLQRAHLGSVSAINTFFIILSNLSIMCCRTSLLELLLWTRLSYQIQQGNWLSSINARSNKNRIICSFGRRKQVVVSQSVKSWRYCREPVYPLTLARSAYCHSQYPLTFPFRSE